MVLSSRFIHTHDIEDNWNKCTTFIPNCGEMIVYDPDDKHEYARFKIGDGKNTIINLPFATSEMTDSIITIRDNVCYIDGGRITDK